jgi:hypothetical protein
MANERIDRAEQESFREKKRAYVRILQSYEEYDFTLYTLGKSGYGVGARNTRATEELRDLLVRHLEVDLRIQNLERELELIAPFEVIEKCRHVFYTLREKARTLAEGEDLLPQPYNSRLAATVAEMRSDLSKGITDSATTVDSMRAGIDEVYALNAPESAIRFWLDSIDGARASRVRRRASGATEPVGKGPAQYRAAAIVGFYLYLAAALITIRQRAHTRYLRAPGPTTKRLK